MPQITAETPKSELTIQGYTFAASTPYVEGHTLNAAEASQLNQVRLENIRNNFAGKIKKLKDAAIAAAKEQGQELAADDVVLTDAQIEDLDKEFSELDASYEFGVRRVGAGPVLSPIEKEARKIAREKISAALAEKGHKIKDLPEGWMDAKIAEVAAAESVRKEAERRVKSVEKIALDEIDLTAEPAQG